MKTSINVMISLFYCTFILTNIQVRCQYNQNQDFQINRQFNQAQDNLDTNDNEEGQQFGVGGGPSSSSSSSSSDYNLAIIASSSMSSAGASPPTSANQLVFNQQCEQVNFDFCSSMPFNYTRMPNIFGDKHQIEASERSQQYKSLVQSGCSGHLLAYLCELLAPICFNNESMKKFVIYPCRSFCRAVKQDCERELYSLYYQVGSPLPKAFDCDILPYESQSGKGDLTGPCHETPTTPPLKTTRPHKDNYWPYQPENHQNIPPFITDTSGLDLSVLEHQQQQQQQQPKRPMMSNNNNQDKTSPPNANNPWISGQQLQSFGQSLWLTLWKYSNLISIITLICLLIILNTRRLQKLHLFHCLSSSRNSSASSNSSQRKLATASGGYPTSLAVAGVNGSHPHQINVHKVTMSPSSSSRSLMLFAGGPSGKLQSKLVNDPMLNAELAAPQKLQMHHMHQKTLIDVTGTFERLNKKHQDRYHQLIKQQQQHEYDYIQVQQQHQHQQPSSSASSALASGQSNQMYKNILLSSPSHQVLLCGGGADQQRQVVSSSNSRLTTTRTISDSPAVFNQPPPPPPIPSTIPHHQHYISPYASPFAASFGASSPAAFEAAASCQLQRSFSRRTARSSAGQVHAYAASSSSAASTSGGSSASSSGNSSSGSSFSPPNLTTGAPANQQQLPVPSPRRL